MQLNSDFMQPLNSFELRRTKGQLPETRNRLVEVFYAIRSIGATFVLKIVNVHELKTLEACKFYLTKSND